MGVVRRGQPTTITSSGQTLSNSGSTPAASAYRCLSTLMRASCCLHNFAAPSAASARSLALTFRSSSFLALALPSQCRSIYSWISCLSWKLMHGNREWDEENNNCMKKKDKQVFFVSSGCSFVLLGRMQEDPAIFCLPFFFSFPFPTFPPLFVSPSRCQTQLQAEELSFLNNSQVD